MPRLLKIRNPFARKTAKLKGESLFSENANIAKGAEEIAYKLAKSNGEIKRCAKAVHTAMVAASKEKTDEKKEKHLKKINALIAKYNNAIAANNNVLRELTGNNNPTASWDDEIISRECTLDDLYV